VRRAQAPRDGQWVEVLKHATGVIADHEAAAGAPILFLPLWLAAELLEVCEPVPGFEGPPPAVAVDARMHMQACLHACREGQASKQARLSRAPLTRRLGKAHFFFAHRAAAARHVRTIAHAIDGARYDLHGFGGALSRRIRRAVFIDGRRKLFLQARARARMNFRAACGLSIAGTEIWESVRRDGASVR